MKQIWFGMKYRCLNKNSNAYKYYGGRGITICDRWLNYDNFAADMGTRPSKKHSIDRIDVNGNYEPSNCRWATSKQQQRNRRNNRHIEHQGRTMIFTEWADFLGVTDKILRDSMRYHKDFAKVYNILTSPSKRNLLGTRFAEGRWYASIKRNCVTYYLGHFKSELEAHHAYLKKYIELPKKNKPKGKATDE